MVHRPFYFSKQENFEIHDIFLFLKIKTQLDDLSVKFFGDFKVMTTYTRKCQDFLNTYFLPSLLCHVGKLGFSLCTR